MTKAKTTPTKSATKATSGSSSATSSSNNGTKSEMAALAKRVQKLEHLCEKLGLMDKYNKYYG